jgi:hypothetical protein
MSQKRSLEAAEGAVAAGLIIGRAVIGAASWLAPERALPALGFNRAADGPMRDGTGRTRNRSRTPFAGRDGTGRTPRPFD